MMTRRLIAIAAFVLSLGAAFAQELVPFDVQLPSTIVVVTFTPIDAEFSKSLNAIIAVSTSPNRLNIYRPDTDNLVTVDLSATPTCVSVSTDGNFAAVGHDDLITYVDLVQASVVKTLPVDADGIIGDIVLAPNGYAYAFPGGANFPQVRSVNIATGADTPHTGGSIYRGTRARLHPSGTVMYGANNGLSPSDIEKYDIAPGTMARLYDSPYHGDFAMCGNLWFTEDGLRIFTRCGNVFRSSTDTSVDMTYNGSLSQETVVRWVTHSSAGSNVAVLPDNDDEVHYYTHDFLAYRGKAILPLFPTTNAVARGRYVFFGTSGAKQYILVEADGGAAFGVTTVDCTSAPVALNPTSMNVAGTASAGQFSVVGTAGCGWKAIASDSWIQTLSSGVSDGTVAFTVTKNLSVTPRTGTITVGNATFTVNQAGMVPLGVTATATSTTSVNVTWTSTASQFEIWRSSGGAFQQIATTAGSPFSDNTVTPSNVYVYKVRAVQDGTPSDFSVPDYTHTVLLTDATLTGVPIRAAHVAELRSIINGFRTIAGVGSATFTDAALVGVAAKRIHIMELRDALNEVRTALGLPAFSYSPLALRNIIQAATTQELRTSVQ